MVLQTLSPATSLREAVLELIRYTSIYLPNDILDRMRDLASKEEQGDRASMIFNILFKNIALAQETQSPLCQDTGTLSFYIKYAKDFNIRSLNDILPKVIVEATKKNYLRPNSVDPITGVNGGDNLGIGFPFVHAEEWDHPETEIKLLLKGGGSENVSAQYSLPLESIGADRDVAGIKKAVLYAIHQAQGHGCSPGIIGVGIGGDRASSYSLAKYQLLRSLNDKNVDPILHEMEMEIYEKANQLEIGPMGLGGKTTVLGIKIGKMHRIPASYFVSVAYLCWAARRHTLICHHDGNYTIQ